MFCEGTQFAHGLGVAPAHADEYEQAALTGVGSRFSTKVGRKNTSMESFHLSAVRLCSVQFATVPGRRLSVAGQMV
jgi:hypothetical protein